VTAAILDGKAISAEVRAQLKAQVKTLSRSGIAPCLVVVLVGDDPASQIYVRNKHLACQEAGIKSIIHRLPAETPQEELLALVNELNRDDSVHGILVQVPLPSQIDEGAVLLSIDPRKDVDGFHPINAGRLLAGEDGFQPCTPAGVMELIHRTGVSLAGKHAVVVGRSSNVGKPTALLLLREHATVTICHSRTAGLDEYCRSADILVAAVGRPQLVKGDWVKTGAIVVDVGINRVDGRVIGDVEFEGAAERASYITPVPGGVGPMTVAMLLANTVKAATGWRG
jgi:methylenetetrahydrofolate dehydrogenase (NADP+)/methenyltetrahydrofolate cyclohydrolase